MTSPRERLKNIEIVILRTLFKRGAMHGPITLLKWKRKFAVNLWRRGFLRVFNEQLPDLGCARSPLYMLTTHGAYLASTLFPAPRGQVSPGAEDVK